MSPLLVQLGQTGIIPALVLDDISRVGPVCHALLEGGLKTLEVTLRSPNAMEVLRKAANYSSDLIVGAGTVYRKEQAKQALEAGAKYIVSPGLDVPLIEFCQEQNVPIIPAAITPAEVMTALNLGLHCVKFFPSHLVGGLPLIKALQGPFPTMKFLATGGITRETMGSFLVHPGILAVGGTWMIRSEWIKKDDYEHITQACQQAMSDVSRLRRPKFGNH